MLPLVELEYIAIPSRTDTDGNDRRAAPGTAERQGFEGSDFDVF